MRAWLMGTETISRHDNHVIWELRDDNADAARDVVMSVVVRTLDGATVALTRDGSLVRDDDTVLAMELVGVDPHSLVVANGAQVVVDNFGRVSLVVDNADELHVSFVNDGVAHSTTHVTKPPSPMSLTSAQVMNMPVTSVGFVAALCVLALRIPAFRSRRSCGVST
jgi:hypothetical protein